MPFAVLVFVLGYLFLCSFPIGLTATAVLGGLWYLETH
jgi:hypothetical protein